MIYEFITFSSCAMPHARVSGVTNLQLRINKYKRENHKQKYLLVIFFLFCSENEYFIPSCSITNAVIFSL